MLYRLDTPSGPVTDPHGPDPLAPHPIHGARVVLCRQFRSARSLAGIVHERTGEPVTITRIGNAGHLSHALTIDRTR